MQVGGNLEARMIRLLDVVRTTMNDFTADVEKFSEICSPVRVSHTGFHILRVLFANGIRAAIVLEYHPDSFINFKIAPTVRERSVFRTVCQTLANQYDHKGVGIASGWEDAEQSNLLVLRVKWPVTTVVIWDRSSRARVSHAHYLQLSLSSR